MGFRASLRFWNDTQAQVRSWSEKLSNEARSYLQDFYSGESDFDRSKMHNYMETLHRLFTSSRAVLLLCMARVTFILCVAPWGSEIPNGYQSVQVKAFRGLVRACWGWHELVHRQWTVGVWIRSACREHFGHQQGSDDDASIHDNVYGYPDEPTDPEDQADFDDIVSHYRTGFDIQDSSKRQVWKYLSDNIPAWAIFDDCYIIGHWARTHDLLRIAMWRYRKIQGKPLRISVIHDEAEAQVSERVARSMAVQFWSSIIEEWRTCDAEDVDWKTLRNLEYLVRASKERGVESWWPRETHSHKEQKDHGELPIKTHCEAILCQEWVNRRVRYHWPP